MTLQVHTSHRSLTKSVTEVLRWKPESKMVVAIAAGESKGEKEKKPNQILWNYKLAVQWQTLRKVYIF